jgi:DNA-binding MarR family transcriptional regulator
MKHFQGNFDFIQTFTLPKLLTHKVGFLLEEITKNYQDYLSLKLNELNLNIKQLKLLIICDEVGPLSQQKISELLQIDRTTMVFLVNSLEKLKIIERQPNHQDRRAYSIVLTSHGKTILKKAILILEKCEKDFFKTLNDEELKKFQETIEKLFINAQTLS